MKHPVDVRKTETKLIHSTFNLFGREKVEQRGRPVERARWTKISIPGWDGCCQLILENLLGISLDGDKTTAARKIHQNGIRFHHGRADDRDHCCRLGQDMPHYDC